jgi:hypothetical protein
VVGQSGAEGSGDVDEKKVERRWAEVVWVW